MPHISFSALKDWNTCAWYHKLTRIDKIRGFKGNAFTAFGNAFMMFARKSLLKEEIDENELFLERFEHFLKELP